MNATNECDRCGEVLCVCKYPNAIDTELRSHIERALSLGVLPTTILANLRAKGEREAVVSQVEKFIMEWDASI